MSPNRILLTGSTGFLGAAIGTELAGRSAWAIRRLSRRRDDGPAGTAHGDLSDPESLLGSCTGIDTVVHAASYVGPDPTLAARINDVGTRALVAEAARAGVRRFIQLSTAAVYGRGPHRGPAEGDLEPAPVSAVSASRLAAESWVRQFGGHVLRPYLIYGPGDRWFVPALVPLLAELSGWIDEGRARISVIARRDLARVTAALVEADVPVPPGGVHHVNHPQPVTIRKLGEALHRSLGVRVPSRNITRAEAERLRTGRGWPDRHLEMLSLDHWYDSNRIWQITGCPPGPPPECDLVHAADWYPDLVTRHTPFSM